MASEIKWVGMRELKAAIARNPETVLSQARLFLTRGLAAYKRGIIRDPWAIGGGGGGAPYRTGNLRDTHLTQINGLEGVIGPNITAAPYARYVHHGTNKMQGRPWLEYVKQTKQGEIEGLYREMLRDIVGDLAK